MTVRLVIDGPGCYSAREMPPLRTYAIVGAGRLGSAIAVALHESGAKVSEIVVRNRASSVKNAKTLARIIGTRVLTDTAQCTADIVWICVADSDIARITAEMANAGAWNGRIVFHSSGALSSDELKPLRRRGAHVASVHPMMSFVRGIRPNLSGVTFAIEGDEEAKRIARQIVRKWKARTVEIQKQHKALYHAWGAFLSPLIVAELAASERVAAQVGINPKQARQIMAPILRQTIENYLQHGAAAAFSGPVVRGDIETVRRHLQVLKKIPAANAVYISLVRGAAELLPAENRDALKELLL